MFNSTPDKWSWSNFKTKWFIASFITLGLFCQLYAGMSCNWQVFTPSDNPTDYWSFLPPDTSTVYSIGLFSYQPKAEEGIKQWDVKCIQYDSFLLPTKLLFIVPQVVPLLSLVAIVIAALFAWSGYNKKKIAYFILIPWCIQAVGFIASLGWCDSDEGAWQCSRLVGFFSNIGAVFLYSVAFVIAKWVLAKEPEPEDDNDDKDEESYISTNANEAPLSKISLDEIPLNVSDSSTDEESAAYQAQSAEEMLGMDDPIAMRSVGINALVIQQMKSFIRKKPQVKVIEDETSFGGSEV